MAFPLIKYKTPTRQKYLHFWSAGGGYGVNGLFKFVKVYIYS
jgi:hypothetical protein